MSHKQLLDLCNQFENTIDMSLIEKIKILDRYGDGYEIYGTMGTVWCKLTDKQKIIVYNTFGLDFDIV